MPGPEVRRVGLFAGEAMLEARLPLPAGAAGWGRALGRESLDSLLLEDYEASLAHESLESALRILK